MEELSLHILDIVENSTRAGARVIRISIIESRSEDLLTIEIEDDGSGMNEETCKKVLDPFFTTKSVRKVGMGIPLVEQAAQTTEGEFVIESEEGKGTRLAASFRLSHIDRQPLGNMGNTMVAIIAGSPSVDLLYSHETDQGKYSLDTREIRETIEDIPIDHSEVLTFIRNSINEGLKEIKAEP